MRTLHLFPSFLVISLLALGGLACSRRGAWEYKVVQVAAQDGGSRTGSGAMRYATVTPAEDQLNELGKEGWELATSYLEMETAYPNFGNSDYVTGLQPNVRPQRLVMIFKRPAKATNTAKNPEKKS